MEKDGEKIGTIEFLISNSSIVEQKRIPKRKKIKERELKSLLH